MSKRRDQQSSKQQNKHIRPSAIEVAGNGPSKAVHLNTAVEGQPRMDSSVYERQYPDKKFIKANDLDGEVQRWIDAGAEPVKRHVEGRKVYAGINDHSDSDWVTWIGGTDSGGKEFLVYLLMIDPEAFAKYKTEPVAARQAEIEKALYRGVNQSGEKETLPGGGSMQTYAPNLPDGSGQGFNQIKG